MIFTIIFVCLTILAIAVGCLYEMEIMNRRDYELEKMKLEIEKERCKFQ